MGLDLGANSIGWALVDESNRRIIAAGVRVFPEGVDNFDTKKEKSKNEDRRVVRGMRRQTARRARRKRLLRLALERCGLFPTDPGEQAALISMDPYALRRRALEERITPHEFGRALLHLNQRRGFLSNRKSDRERKKETQGMLAEINELAAKIEQSGSRTVGEHLAKQRALNPLIAVRKHHTRRDMFEQEFELLWEAQRKYHPNLLTETLKYGQQGKQPGVREPKPLGNGRTHVEAFGLHGMMFFQRPMYWPKSIVGQCELEPKCKRCPRADRLAQRFRLLQEVNNLRYLDPATGDECPLSAQQRTLLLDKLSKCKEMTFDQIRSALGFIESISFNLERGKRSKLQGMVTDALLAHKELFGAGWHKRPDEERTQIVRTLIHGGEEEIRRQACKGWGVDEATAERLLDVDLPSGYAGLSITAMEKLVPHMERGLLYMTNDGTPSALSQAGYLRPDQIAATVLDELPEPPTVTNPVVRQALYELRKVVNSIVRRYGRPARIHLELARNATASSEERKKMSERMRERERERDAAAEKIREHGVKVTREAIDRYLLWEEQKGECIYSGEAISVSQLLGGEVHVDHILPYSRSLDDSFANKVVCLLRANADKGNKTPHEWLADRDRRRYELVCQRAAKLPYNKRRRFTQKELELDKFIERQLNDTRYINRLAREYLQCLVAEPHHVLCPKGNHTETYRWLWGLNGVLREDSVNRKNRTDHRHHAIDAIVIALTDQRRLQALAAVLRYDGPGVPESRLAEPWEGFRADVECVVQGINVSHRPRRKIAGALHEDTLYGPTAKAGEFVVRKAVEALTPAMIDDIRDPAIRRIVIERLKQHGIEHGRGAKSTISAEVWKEPLRMASGVPIKRVRLVKRDQTIRPIRGGTAWVKPGSVHHACIFEVTDPSGKRRRYAIYVTMLDALMRIRRCEPVVQRSDPDCPDARFIMSLCSGDMLLAKLDGRERLVVVSTLVSTQGRIHVVDATDSRPGAQKKDVGKTPNSLIARKVTVTPLGEIRWAND